MIDIKVNSSMNGTQLNGGNRAAMATSLKLTNKGRVILTLR